MRKFLNISTAYSFGALFCAVLLMNTLSLSAQQVSNANFEDWSGAAFNGEAQPKGWNASNVEQVGFKFNFAHKETGHNGGYCMMVQDQSVGAFGITETSPGYFALGQPWSYLDGLNVNGATAGTAGGIKWTYRPDTMSVWIKRTGDNWDKEDFYLLYYAWSGQARGDKYKAKNLSCTSVTKYDEESDIRLALNGNECGTAVKVTQVAEGMWRERKNYGQWTNIRVPIYYMNNTDPTTMNIIFSASNYPNFRANSGLYAGNSLYVDDVEMIYSSKIHKLYIDGKEWKGFDPNSSEVQTYALGENATAVPSIEALRGAGSLTNAAGTTVQFAGRTLSGSEITITKGDLSSKPTTIVVKSEDGKSTTTYKIQFTKAASSNAKLASISVNGAVIEGFSPTKYTYNVTLPYGTTAVPVVAAEGQEDGQTIAVTQPTSTAGTAVIKVTAANKTATQTYTLNFSVGQLADNTLRDIRVNGNSIPGFTPSQATYKVSLPVGTSKLTIEPVSAYEAGAQTITVTPATLPTGEAINGATVQISVTTPGNQTPKVYKLNFRLEASSYTYLKDLQVSGSQIQQCSPAKDGDLQQIAFTPENMTYYVNLRMGTKQLPQITYTPGDEYQTVKIDTAGIDGTTRITVTAGNKTDQSVYKIIFSTEKSEISTLAGIKVGGVLIDGFRSDKTTYDYPLPVGTTVLPEIEPVAGDEFQKITVTTNGVNGATRITVTAENGNTTVYVINFSVAAYTDNTLKALYVDGVLIDGWNPEANDYAVNLPQGTTVLPAVTYELQNADLQTVTERKPSGVTGDYRITVRPQSGASRTYTIRFSVATSSNTALAMIYVDGEPLENFQPEDTLYTYNLPEGVTTIPPVTFDKAETTQRVLSVLRDTVQTLTVTAESGAKRVYKVNFHIQLSENAFLEMIYLDGDSLEGFDPRTFDYTVELAGATSPAITVAKVPGQQTTITQPLGVGTATILVAPVIGATQRYTIHFVAKPAETVQLTNILIDGVALAGFDPATEHYEQTYSRTLPVVTYEAEAGRTVQLLWRGATAYLHVSDTLGAKAVYDIVFTRLFDSNTALASIKENGVEIDGFAAERRHYDFLLPAGSAYPVLGYEKGDSLQTVDFGQTGEGAWQWIVTAENGTDTARYSVSYAVQLYTDSLLTDLQLLDLPEGQTFTFDPSQTAYSGIQLGEGAPLPDMAITARPKQQILTYQADENTQVVVVTAENGAQTTYTILYTRTRSSNALLANIYVDGAPLYGFAPETHTYTYPLPHGATFVPSVFPVGQQDNQTITTWISRPNGTTTIRVMAQDSTTADYTIAFPVTLSTNTKLGSLKINNETRSVDTTEYVFDMPYGTVYPYELQFAKAEPEQSIEFIEAPLNGTTRIIVRAENGDSRTYSIRYNVAQPEGENLIRRVAYTYKTATNVIKRDTIVPVIGDNVISLPYGAKSFEVTGVEKNYPEQSVVFYNGGIRRGATIIAAANREGVEDVTYTITPQMPAFDTAGKLKELKFKGTAVPNFRPDVYNYMINVTAQPTAADFVGTAYESGKSVTKSAIDAKKKQITLTVSGGETYSICWYYENDDPQFDFSNNWVAAAKGPGYKPTSAWKVPADYADKHEFNIDFIVHVNLIYQTGKEVIKAGVNGALLSTLRGAPLNGSVPGMMTTGTMALTLASSGNSTSSMSMDKSTGVVFRNTPEQFTLDYNPLTTTNVSKWYYDILLSDGTNTKTTHYDGNYNTLNSWQVSTKTLDYSGLGTLQRMTFAINSAHTANAKDMGSGATDQAMFESQLLVQNLRFIYNSELTGVTVDGVAATKSGNTFTRTVSADYVGLPALKFTGAVHDQMQTIEWLNNGEWMNGELQAKVVNYGENSTDSTVYTVVLKRAAVTTTDYEISLGSDSTKTVGDTTFVYLPYGTKSLPDVAITPASIHQRFAVSKSGNTVKVTVTAENGTAKTTVYAYRDAKADDPGLETFDLEDTNGASVAYSTVDADAFIYSMTTAKTPLITYEKKSDGQRVDLKYLADGIVMTVTAEDGTTQRTYTFNRIDPVVVTKGKIESFAIAGTGLDYIGGDTYEAEHTKPEGIITFVREAETDSVVFVQTPDSMAWRVYGNETHTYRITYPTEASSNAQLANILVNGNPLEDYLPTLESYEIASDTAVTVNAVAAEAAQTIAVTATPADAGINYEVAVTAADGATHKTYTLSVIRPLSDDASLAAIWLDGAPLADFTPAETDYTVVLPSPAVKKQQPQMPSISYVAGQSGQKIELEPGEMNNAPTQIIVTSEKGSYRTYNVQVSAEPSHNTELTGIMVNGNLLEGFESGRHFYSVELATDEIEILTTAEDCFQTVDVIRAATDKDADTVRVTAEDGVNTAKYAVKIFVQKPSSDAQLAAILLDGAPLTDYRRDINPALTFNPGNNHYDINLPSGTTVLPEVSAQLKMDGQQADVQKNGMVVTITVTAVDGTENTYTLNFLTPKSRYADLSMIFIDGDSLPDFRHDVYFYKVELPVGTHGLPETIGQEGEATQTVHAAEMDNEKQQATIRVEAEDNTYSNTYTVLYQFNQSAADTLLMLYADGDSLTGFAPRKFFYTDSLAVGTTAFPELNWEEADEWQTIALDTVLSDASNLIRTVKVTAENGNSNTYTVSYTIRQSDIDTLQALFVDNKVLEDFNARTMEYYYLLTAEQAAEQNGALPQITYTEGDKYQTVLVSQAPDSLSGKSLGYKSLITVTAATGAMRTYTIHYPVERSADATLNMIMLGGQPLPDFDAERYTYSPVIEGRQPLPLVSVVKKEEAQTYEIFVDTDTVRIMVTAENGDTQDYTLKFNRQLSDNTRLANILIDGHREFRFDPDEFDYLVVLPYGEDTVPAIEVALQDTLQTVPEYRYDTLANGDIQVIITVIAADGRNEGTYTLTVRFTRNNDALLTAIYVKDELLAGFDSRLTEYELYHPYGTDTAAFYQAEDIRVEKSDTTATVAVSLADDGTISINVVAADGVTEQTYLIRQFVSADTDNYLSAILLDGDTIKGFDPELTFYTYLLVEGQQPPAVEAVCRSVNAEASWRTVSAGDTCRIACTAADGSERIYYVYFAISTINEAANPTYNDVLLKRMPGEANMLAATLRKDVSICLYDQTGHLVFYSKVPVADPNDVSVSDDPATIERLNDVANASSGLLIPIVPGQIYQYAFMVSDSKIIKSGKFIAQ
ncbi:MAG: hypothetical protein IJ814_06430 [Paludibacteraceae bacterium]|nr:hypothetical protein [Paludibacteraceae bacterium]